MNPITTSIFDLFKIGPGPSSSHTIGPMRAACRFLESIESLPDSQIKLADKIDVYLYGSLSATGKGHGTDQAILAGLLGWRPEACDSEAFVKLFNGPRKIYCLKIKGKTIPFSSKNIHFDKIVHSFPFQNTLVLKLSAGKKLILEKTYYSIGGGFIKCKDEKEAKRPLPVYRYSNMSELIALACAHKMSLGDIILANEQAITGKSKKSILKELKNIIAAMLESVERGLHAEGVLPGSIGLSRKAHALFIRQHLPEHTPGRFMVLMSSYAMAAAEENASHHKVVTAPTLGSAGVIPGILYMLKSHLNTPDRVLCEGMLAASAVGFIIKHNASISGAEVGCQGEIGVACSMAAALLAYINKHDIHRVANAAEIALEHCLGWTCDPIGGYVQIPCIERNAIGAVHSVNAYVLATVGSPKRQKIGFDQVVEAMLETGRDMSKKYKETSEGGLASVCAAIC